MKTDKHKHVHYLRNGLEQFLIEEDKHIANGTPRLRGEQYFALSALTKLSDSKIAASYYKLPTGFGKTVMFSYMAQAYLQQARANGNTKKLVILVPRLNLINQTGDKLDSFAGFAASEFSGRTKGTKADIIISTYRSLDKLIETIGFENIGMVFADEAHHVTGGKTSQTMANLMKSVPTIGFTATPSYNVDKSVGNIMETEIFAITIADGVHSGMLAPVKNTLYCSSIVCDLENVPATGKGEYDYKSITSQIDTDTLTGEIADIYINGIDEDTGRRFIDCKAMINCPNIEIAKRQADTINQKVGHIIAHAFSSDMKDFETEKAKFIAGKYQVACQVNTLTEGFDDTAVSLCINYPTRSAVRAEQAAGRAIRLNESDPHKTAFVIDTIFRKYDGETSDTALQTARHAKQVLFKDIAGGIVLFPKNFNNGITHGRQRTHSRDKHETVRTYEIITSTETLLTLNRIDTERAKEENIPESTEEWLIIAELSKIFIGGSEKIRKLMTQAQHKMPDEIQLRKLKSGKIALCLNSGAIDKFAKLSGLTLQGKFLPKTEDWLNSDDLVRDYFTPNKQKIAQLLREAQKIMPEYVQERQSKSGHLTLCIHNSAIDKFAEFSKFNRRTSFPPKTEEWLSFNDLTKLIIGHRPKISTLLKEFRNTMPNDIQMRQPKSGSPALYIHKDAVNKFAKLSGLQLIGAYGVKTDEWLSSNDLIKIFMGGLHKILDSLRQLQISMPDVIQVRQYPGGVTALCLHRSAINKFAKETGLILKTYLLEKTDEWLSAQELNKYIIGIPKNFLKLMQKLQNIMPDDIQIRKSRAGETLCLHRNAIQKFADVADLMLQGQYGPKTNEWLASKDLTKYFVGNSKKMLTILQENQKNMGNDIQLRKYTGGISLCLNINALDEFTRLTGLKRRNNITPEKLRTGTKVVQAMIEMEKNKKHVKNAGKSDNQYE